jgi:pyruvate dehydrogenase E2 component (dihydrolipoamide acetyltransferase)
MAVSVVMPALEMAQETGKLVLWLKQEGDSVTRGEPLLEIETDKATVEVEAAADGILANVTAQPGEDIPVGRIIAWIVQPGETVPNLEPQPVAPSDHQISPEAPPSSIPSRPESSPRRISPKARRMAQEAGIDLALIPSSGPDGEILASDVHAAIQKATAAQAAPSAAPPLSSVHRLMAERTLQSWTTVPHFFIQKDADASALNRFRSDYRTAPDPSARITHTDLLIALVARTLVRHPRLNAAWAGDNLIENAQVNIALAIAVEDGVIAPVISGADTATLTDIAARRSDLALRARSGRLRPADLAGGTFAISNLGMFGVDAFSAIIMPPQAAILAIGQIADRAVVVKGEIAIRPMLTMTLSSDHRVLDGAKAAAFLRDLSGAISEPDLWLT